MPQSKREELIETAIKLFYREGFHATGIDKLLAESGCAKMTLYKYFRSKEELILAALRRLDEMARLEFERETERRAKTPVGRLLAMFDVLGGFIERPEFNGCYFINASAEYSHPDHPIQRLCAENKRLTTRYIEGLCAAAGAPDPAGLARKLNLLLEGAIVTAHVARDPNAVADAKEAGRALIEKATGTSAAHAA